MKVQNEFGDIGEFVDWAKSEDAEFDKGSKSNTKVCQKCLHNPCICSQVKQQETKPYKPPVFKQGGYRQGGYRKTSTSYHQYGYHQRGWNKTTRRNNASKGLDGLVDLAKAETDE